jgi:hypothetical protein
VIGRAALPWMMDDIVLSRTNPLYSVKLKKIYIFMPFLFFGNSFQNNIAKSYRLPNDYTKSYRLPNDYIIKRREYKITCHWHACSATLDDVGRNDEL